MQNQNTNIELSSQPPSSQAQNPNNHSYFPQEDEESPISLQSLPQGPQTPPQSSGLEGKLEACVKRIINQNPKKVVRRAALLMTVFLFLGFIPLTYFFFHELNPYSDKVRGPLESMAANLMTDPIMDIQIIDKESACPSGFEALELGVWNGTKAGCHCDNGDLFESPCGKDQAETTCKTIPKALPFEINELNNLIWCGKRAVLGADYVKQAECPSGFHECYPGGCFINEDCPITKVEVASSGEANKKFSKTEDKYIILTRTKGEFPLINVKTSPNDIPCFNQNVYAKPPSSDYPPYKLLVLNQSGCDSYGLDSKFSKQLDSQSIFDSYTQNTFKYSTMNLPDYEKYAKNATSVLSWRARMTTKRDDHCLNLDKKLIEKSIVAVNRSFLSGEDFFSFLRGHCIFVLILIFIPCFCSGEGLSSLEVFVSPKFIAVFLQSYIPLVVWISERMDNIKDLNMAIQYFALCDSLRCFEGGQGNLLVRDYIEILGIAKLRYTLTIGFLISFSLALLVSICSWPFQKKSCEEMSNPEGSAGSSI